MAVSSFDVLNLVTCLLKQLLQLLFISLVLSPPMSPTHFSGDEAVHVRSILEGVCHTSDIGKDAIRKLCSHVQADQQEEQVHVDKMRASAAHHFVVDLLCMFRDF